MWGKRLAFGVWRLAVGGWWLVVGGWWLAVGVWCLVFGVWCLFGNIPLARFASLRAFSETKKVQEVGEFIIDISFEKHSTKIYFWFRFKNSDFIEGELAQLVDASRMLSGRSANNNLK